MPIEIVNNYLNYSYNVLSLEQPINEEGDYTILDSIASKDNVESPVFQSLLKTDINLLFSNLGIREAMVIKLRYGLDGNKQMTLEEVGEVLGLSKGRVREIENKTLRKMRKNAWLDQSCRPLREYLK